MPMRNSSNMDKNLLIDLNEGLKQDDYHHLIQSEPNQDSNSTSSSHQMLDQECEPQQRHALNQDFQTAEVKLVSHFPNFVLYLAVVCKYIPILLFF